MRKQHRVYCALILVLVLAFGRRVAPAVMLDLIALLLIVVGFLFGIIALFGIPRYGAKGILGPAILGIIINGVLLFIFFTNFFAARARAQRSDSGTPPAVVVASNRS